MASSRGIFPTQRLNPRLLHLPALASGFFTTSTTWEIEGHVSKYKFSEVGGWTLCF